VHATLLPLDLTVVRSSRRVVGIIELVVGRDSFPGVPGRERRIEDGR